MQYLYLIECQRFFKIGITTNMKTRLKALQVGNPYPLDVVAVYKFPKNFASRMESRIHRTFTKWNIRGEWFVLSDAQLNVIKGQCNAFAKP